MSKYQDYKEQVFDVTKRLQAMGYFGTKSGSGGNVSMWIEGEEAIAVTPSDLKYDDMTVDDICIVDYNLKWIESKHEPSREAGMHLTCYKNRTDVSSVIHTHQPAVSALSLLNIPIPALFDEVCLAIGKEVAVVPYGLSGSDELIAGVASVLENRCHCYILQNHGALSIGPNLEKTFHFAELFEKLASAYLAALSTGREITELPEMIRDGVFQLTQMKQDMESARKEALANA